jgi:hypothetical protein
MRIIAKEQTKGVMWVAFGLLLFYALIVCLTDFGGINLFAITGVFFSCLITTVRIADPECLPISILSNNKFWQGTFVFLIVFMLAHGVFVLWEVISTG